MVADTGCHSAAVHLRLSPLLKHNIPIYSNKALHTPPPLFSDTVSILYLVSVSNPLIARDGLAFQGHWQHLPCFVLLLIILEVQTCFFIQCLEVLRISNMIYVVNQYHLQQKLSCCDYHLRESFCIVDSLGVGDQLTSHIRCLTMRTSLVT